ncbi:unnamed protein product [Didymodactylos carnosus]|uniref:Uncharacterized protein n=1 Tax=Didymodactylos carnosus TaxID=1234261 RepID=A0A814I1J6_9BILA|nr:unnamed protein product [Didymodactylos carnosus]CAF3789775.1 unnamed protein product [Didymodactylos carnosus]
MRMKGSRAPFTHTSLALFVLVTGVAGGLLIVFSILLLCKYCFNRKNTKQSEQVKLLYGALDSTKFRIDNTQLKLEPRRSNPLDKYHEERSKLLEEQSDLRNPSYHGSREQISKHDLNSSSYVFDGTLTENTPNILLYSATNESKNDNHQNERLNDNSYLQVDPRCYVRNNSTCSHLTVMPNLLPRKSDPCCGPTTSTARLEKVYSLNSDQRQLRLTSHRQSSFDVATYRQQLNPTNDTSPSFYSQEVYYTPRGSNLSVAQTTTAHPTNSPANLDPNYIYHQIPHNRKNSAIILTPNDSTSAEKRDLAVTYDINSNRGGVRSVALEKQKSSDLTPGNEIDKQSLSFDAVHLLRPGNRPDVTRRAKSYDYDDQHRANATSKQMPIVIKIPDIEKLTSEFVVQNTSKRLSYMKQHSLEQYSNQQLHRSFNIPHTSGGRKATLIDTRFVQLNNADTSQPVEGTVQVQDGRELWALRKSYEMEANFDNATMNLVNEQEHHQCEQDINDITSPEELSPEFHTSISTSFDSNPEPSSATKRHYDYHHQPSYLRSHTIDINSNRLLPTPNDLPSHTVDTTTNSNDIVDTEVYKLRRKSSSNLLLPPPEVRRQALRRTFEKRRSCISQSNALLKSNEEQQAAASVAENFTAITMTNLIEHQLQLDNSTITSDFNSMNNNYNSKSENSSFERSLETDFDMQSDTSSRPGDQFTSIESSGNENTDSNNSGKQCASTYIMEKKDLLPSSIPQQHDDSGYKSLESQTSQNRTVSLDWMSVDGAESVIYLGGGSHDEQHISIDSQDIEEELNETSAQEQIYQMRRSPVPNSMLKYGQSSYESQRKLTPVIQYRSLSTSIPVAEDRYKISSPQLTTAVANGYDKLAEYSSKIVSSPSFNRTASKKRREFGKDKKDALKDEQRQQPQISQQQQRTSSWNCQQSADNQPDVSLAVQKSSLQVKHDHLRRTKSDDSRNLYAMPNHINNENNNHLQNLNNSDNRHVTLSADRILNKSNPRHALPFIVPDNRPNNNNYEAISHYESVTSNEPNQSCNETVSATNLQSPLAFRSKHGSFSFDASSQHKLMQHHLHSASIDISSASSSQNNKNDKQHFYDQIIDTNTLKQSILPVGHMTKPRLKFSIVRDSSIPAYSTPLFRDYSIDEKTNRIVNEFLKDDSLLDASQRHPYRSCRAKTIDESNNKHYKIQQDNNRQNFKRHNNSIVRPTPPMMMVSNEPRYINLTKRATLSFSDSIEEELQQSQHQRYPIKTNAAPPSINIIITGEDSGS